MKRIFDRPVRNGKKFENNYSHRGGANGVSQYGIHTSDGRRRHAQIILSVDLTIICACVA
jgi:hypothetical protein